ncbi:MAG: hypothetical protein Q9195_005283 [Heterodermia aff. obscurata]
MRLKRQYKQGTYSTNIDAGPDGTPRNLLRSIIQNPQIAPYVQSLHIVKEATSSRFYIEKDMVDLFRNAAQNCPMITDKGERKRLLSGLFGGAEEPIIVLLLHLLPNLVNLHLEGWSEGGLLGQTLKRIGKSQDKVILPKVNAFELHNFILRDFWMPGEIFTSMSLLPSMRRISALDVDEDRNQNRDFNQTLGRAATKSPVTSLQLANCRIRLDVLCRLLKSTENLTSFSYCSKTKQPDPKWILAMLLSYTEDTLRDLTMFPLDNNVSYVGSLREFKALEKVSTSYQLLQQDPNEPDWSQILPQTLKSLKLHDASGGADYEPLFYCKLMDALMAIKETEIPELEYLHYEFNEEAILSEQNKNTLKSRFARQCAEAGVRFQLDWVSVAAEAKGKRQIAEVLEGSDLVKRAPRTAGTRPIPRHLLNS